MRESQSCFSHREPPTPIALSWEEITGEGALQTTSFHMLFCRYLIPATIWKKVLGWMALCSGPWQLFVCYFAQGGLTNHLFPPMCSKPSFLRCCIVALYFENPATTESPGSTSERLKEPGCCPPWPLPASSVPS